MDRVVREVVERIVESVKPDKVILFGSRASGQACPDSDIDLVVVYAGPKSKHELEVGIHKLFRNPSFSMDVFVMTPEELEAQKTVANSLAREITERGLVCYG